MKKVIVVILATLVCIGHCSQVLAEVVSTTVEEAKDALGEQWDLVESMSNEQLVFLKLIVDIAVMERGLNSFIVSRDGTITLYANANSADTASGNYPPWYDYGAGQYLPSPNAILGRTIASNPQSKINTDGVFYEELLDCSDEDMEKLSSAYRAYGFNLNVQTTSVSFQGEDSHGHTVYLVKFETMISVSMT